MDILSSTGVKIVSIITVISILFFAVLVGKFFYVSPFKEWYDKMKKENITIIVGTVGIVSTVMMWIGLLTEVEGLVMLGFVIAFFAWGSFTVGAIIIGCFEIVPFMQRVHQKIIDKRTKE